MNIHPLPDKLNTIRHNCVDTRSVKSMKPVVEIEEPSTISLSPYGKARSTIEGSPLSPEELRKTNAYWRACNYLALGMIYLQSNPLLKEPLKPEHIKNRLLGHWGSSPGLAFIYLHLNRLIKKYDLDMIFMAGPGHGAPGVLAPGYLEGTYSEIYPEKSEDERGLHEFFKQFSFPGGIGSHCTPETPGSIHEGGELGYVLSHACGAAFDNPELIVAAVVGDGESETGPLATSWHISKFLNPIRDGAVLPILHLNGYKINNPTLLSRITHEELEDLMSGYGWTPHFVEGSGDGGNGGALRPGNSFTSAGMPRDGRGEASSLADDRVAISKRLDGTEGIWRSLHRGVLACTSGALDGCQEESGTAPDTREVDAGSKAGGAV
jgi:xylulose-5-phosphate/fructose-6-phosphate phosphoketolase